VVQPAHRRFVNMTWQITLVRPRVVARRTHFVEIGPLVAISPNGRSTVIPFPEEARMGWGLEALWGTASIQGAVTLGIVDAVTIEHLSPIGGSYDLAAASEEFQRFAGQAGLVDLDTLMVNVDRWRRLGPARDWRAHESRP
jgi:hypothetical protein